MNTVEEECEGRVSSGGRYIFGPEFFPLADIVMEAEALLCKQGPGTLDWVTFVGSRASRGRLPGEHCSGRGSAGRHKVFESQDEGPDLHRERGSLHLLSSEPLCL